MATRQINDFTYIIAFPRQAQALNLMLVHEHGGWRTMYRRSSVRSLPPTWILLQLPGPGLELLLPPFPELNLPPRSEEAGL